MEDVTNEITSADGGTARSVLSLPRCPARLTQTVRGEVHEPVHDRPSTGFEVILV
jgi:hypothetical protein